MANAWYVQHAGKQHGPFTPAQLKSLATDNKITPTTLVRLGEQGNWVPAARVQGLFAASPPAPSGAPGAAKPPPGSPPKMPAAAQPPVRPQPPRAQAVAPPAPPPRAAPLMPAAAVLPKALPQPTHADRIRGKIISAVAVILGTVALSTCWLPILGGAISWTSIVLGGLGFVLGVTGLVFAALDKGSGLSLAISGTSSSAVALVLTLVLAVKFGLFAAAPMAAVVTAPPTPPPPAIVQPPAPVFTPEPEPQPEPEPVWTDAGQTVEVDGVRVRIADISIEQIRLENTDLTSMKRQKPQPMLKLVIEVENATEDRIIEFVGWNGGGDLISQGVGQLLGGEVGKAVQSATATAALADNIGNPYKQTPPAMLATAQLIGGKDHSVRPGATAKAELIFPPPLASIEFLRLQLPAVVFGSEETIRFHIPRASIRGM